MLLIVTNGVLFSTSGHSNAQAPLRHIEVITYRCFLPDLTRFMSSHCARPNRCRGPTLKAGSRNRLIEAGTKRAFKHFVPASIKSIYKYIIYIIYIINGGERGIRTLGTVLAYTRFPIVLLQPARTPLHVLRHIQDYILFYFKMQVSLYGIFLAASGLLIFAAKPQPEKGCYHFQISVGVASPTEARKFG